MSRYRIGVLLYFRSAEDKLLLIQRRRAPNAGLWCAVGGKLEMESGESPFECARREAREEIGVEIGDSDLSLRCLLSEREYENTGHWLMFVFEVRKRLREIPKDIQEGTFGFFAIEDLQELPMPWLDKSILTDKILNPGGAKFYSVHVKDGIRYDPDAVVVEERIGG